MDDNIKAKIAAWALIGDVGASSRCMAAHLCGLKCDGSYPLDGGDFERCLKLLDAVPELRPALHRMAKVNDMWAALVKKWDEIEALVRADKDAYKLIRKTLAPAEDKDPNLIRIGKNASIRFGPIPAVRRGRCR